MSIKSLIIMILPFIIFGLLYKAAKSFTQSASSFILLIFMSLIFSNGITTFLSQFLGHWIYQLGSIIQPPNSQTELTPLWVMNFPAMIPNSWALFTGLMFGFISNYLPKNSINQFDSAIDYVTQKMVIFLRTLVPFFVTGFVGKIYVEGMLTLLFKEYAAVLATIALAQSFYIVFLYAFIHNYNIKKTLNHLKDMLPAALTGFCTMSSAAAMPLTILATEKNANNKTLARSIIPVTVNVHLLGDCIAIPVLAYAILQQYGLNEPSMMHYSVFVGYFVIAKFSVAAIPGGGILVMLPILESQLGLQADMLALITALYILFAPVITSFNILGNGAFAKGIDKITSNTEVKNRKTQIIETQR